MHINYNKRIIKKKYINKTMCKLEKKKIIIVLETQIMFKFIVIIKIPITL